MTDDVLPNPNTLQALLYGLATITGEVAEQLENTSSSIGQDLMKLAAQHDDIIVKLQDFDRMCQKLMGVSQALRRGSALIADCDATPPQMLDKIVEQVPMRQLRHRIQHAMACPGEAAVASIEDEAEF
jgi:hypothetical protein